MVGLATFVTIADILNLETAVGWGAECTLFFVWQGEDGSLILKTVILERAVGRSAEQHSAAASHGSGDDANEEVGSVSKTQFGLQR